MTYRAFSVGNDWHFIAADFITADNDASAISQASELVREGVGIELWHLARQIVILPQNTLAAIV